MKGTPLGLEVTLANILAYLTQPLLERSHLTELQTGAFEQV